VRISTRAAGTLLVVSAAAVVSAGVVAAGPAGLASAGPGDAASPPPDGSNAEVSRLSPGRRLFTAAETAAFKRLFADLAPGSVPVAHGRTQFGGEVWSLTTWKDKAGRSCRGINVPGEGHSRNCEPTSELLAERPIWFSRGAGAREGSNGWHAVWLRGFVAPSVKSLVVTTAKCDQVPLEFGTDGVFFHLISGADAAAGAWPIRLDAFDASGAIVSSTRIPMTTPDVKTFAAHQPSCP
jgi:hypothetical protein